MVRILGVSHVLEVYLVLLIGIYAVALVLKSVSANISLAKRT